VEPHPTCKFEFKWVLGQTSLRVTKSSDGPRVVAWVWPKSKTHESTSQIKNTTDLELQPTGPIDVDRIGKEVLLQNHLEASGKAESEVNLMGHLDDPIDVDPTVAELAEEDEGSVYSNADAKAKIEVIPCDPLLVKETLASSDSSSSSLVRVDLAENIHLEDLDGALVLGSTHELAVPSAIMGLELEYMDSVARSPVLELLEFAAEPQSPMDCNHWLLLSLLSRRL
jgi:hypothetical protein